MRRISNFISWLLIVAIVVGLVAFSIGNGTQFSLWFFGFTFYHVPVWLPTVVGAVVGFLLAFFVLTPGRLRGAWENNRLLNRISRHEAASEKELSGLRQSTAEASEKELSGLRQRNAELEQEKELKQNSTETQVKGRSTDLATCVETPLSSRNEKSFSPVKEERLERWSASPG